MNVQPSDLRIIADARQQLGIPENVEATPAQVLQMLHVVPEDVAERMVADWRDHSRQAADCWMRNHERQIAYWREIALTRCPECHPLAEEAS